MASAAFACRAGQCGGLLTVLASRKPKFFSEETLCLYTHRLGFGHVHEEAGYGCFSDKHESEENKSDRVTRFLPEHDKYFKSSICEFSYQGQILPIDSRLVDVDGNDLIQARVTLYDIVDKGGTRMSIDVDTGGIIPDGEEPVHVLTSHDESCFAAGDFTTSHFCT